MNQDMSGLGIDVILVEIAQGTALAMMTSSMETFSVLLAICTGNLTITGEIPAQVSLTQSFDVSFDLRIE